MTAWAITAYFNPARFRRRYANYQAFRRALPLPLLTIEWSPEGRFDLCPDDADLLIQVRGGHLMWQKERLLNMAETRLPRSCEQVAWLDCDVIYADDRWVGDMELALKVTPFLQLFSTVVHLPASPPGASGAPVLSDKGALLTRAALAQNSDGWTRALRADPLEVNDQCEPVPADGETEALERSRMASRPSSGHAWAARRDLLAEHGLYDACICGVGDMATALAALGHARDFVGGYPMSAAQSDHYLAWAEPFGRAVGGRVGYLPATLYHLFHGRMVDRQYRTRLGRLAASGFDPARDLCRNPEGPWQWVAPDAELARFMGDYFQGRLEDTAA